MLLFFLGNQTHCCAIWKPKSISTTLEAFLVGEHTQCLCSCYPGQLRRFMGPGLGHSALHPDARERHNLRDGDLGWPMGAEEVGDRLLGRSPVRRDERQDERYECTLR